MLTIHEFVVTCFSVLTGTLQNRGTLDGSNEGITSIEFDPTVKHYHIHTNDYKINVSISNSSFIIVAVLDLF